MGRPLLVVGFVGLVVITLGETAGAVMSPPRPQLVDPARERLAADPRAHRPLVLRIWT